jgi:hypothetical protein
MTLPRHIQNINLVNLQATTSSAFVQSSAHRRKSESERRHQSIDISLLSRVVGQSVVRMSKRRIRRAPVFVKASLYWEIVEMHLRI